MSTAEPGTFDRGGSDPLARRVLILAAIVVVLAAVAVGFQVFGSNGTSYLLEPGPTQAPRGFAGAALMGHVSPEELVTGSEVVFVGTVVGEGDPQLIGDPIADPLGQGATVHPVHFAVEQTLRGEPAPTLDLLFPAFAGDTVDIFETGDRLLVFARPVVFGHNQIAGVTPSGYNQGVFRMESDLVARNETTGVGMSVPALADALGR